MIKRLLSALAFAAIVANAGAQSIEEPEFVGESILVKSDNTGIPMEKQLSVGRRVASTGLLLTGIGKVREQLQIEGCCSTVTVPASEDISVIVRNTDNNSDPLSIIRIFKFEKKPKFRRAEVASMNSFGAAKSNNMDYVKFTGKKYGTSSYLLKLGHLAPGEYGITVSNPNAIDEKQTVVAAFAVR